MCERKRGGFPSSSRALHHPRRLRRRRRLFILFIKIPTILGARMLLPADSRLPRLPCRGSDVEFPPGTKPAPLFRRASQTDAEKGEDVKGRMPLMPHPDKDVGKSAALSLLKAGWLCYAAPASVEKRRRAEGRNSRRALFFCTLFFW